jgi:hypothetical protein
MKAYERITLSGTQLLYVALSLLVVIPVVVAFAFQPVLQNVWCQQFEMAGYEKELGFKLGPISYTTQSGAQRESIGITWVDPSGSLGRSGIRAGDFPHMHHGIVDLCTNLSMVTRGYAVSLDVINAADVARGETARRMVTVRRVEP